MKAGKGLRPFLNSNINMGINKIDLDKAVADCNKVIEKAPKYTDAYFARARVYLLANDFDKAWADVHKAEGLGYAIEAKFLTDLKKASGRDK